MCFCTLEKIAIWGMQDERRGKYSLAMRFILQVYKPLAVLSDAVYIISAPLPTNSGTPRSIGFPNLNQTEVACQERDIPSYIPVTPTLLIFVIGHGIREPTCLSKNKTSWPAYSTRSSIMWVISHRPEWEAVYNFLWIYPLLNHHFSPTRKPIPLTISLALEFYQ